jgi:hypothetical protein
MAQCNFSIHLQLSADEVAQRARAAILNAGGSFSGNAASGNFDVSTPLGAIRGNYVIQHPVIHVTITSKPFLVSCSIIEKQLRGYFASVVA